MRGIVELFGWYDTRYESVSYPKGKSFAESLLDEKRLNLLYVGRSVRG